MSNLFMKLVYGATYYFMKDKLVACLAILFLLLVLASPGFLERVPEYIDYNTLSLIIFYLLVSRGMVVSGLTDNFAIKMINLAGENSRKLFLVILLCATLLSVVATNDGAVLILVPLVMSLARIINVDPTDSVIMVLLAANTGSILMPFSNPQNIIIWQHYGLGFVEVISITALLTLIGLMVLVIYSSFYLSRRTIITAKTVLPRIRIRRSISMVSVILLIIGVVLGELHLGFYALLLGIIIYLLVDWRILRGIDLKLILAFALMFPDFKELAYIISGFNISMFTGLNLYFISIVLSQFISNVPATIALISFTSDWKTLIIGVNIAGYITPLGSMANVIGLRLSGIKGGTYIIKTMIYSFIMFFIGLVLVIFWSS